MKLIPLGISGNFTKIDDQDFDLVSGFRWIAKKGRKNLYAYCKRMENGKMRYYYLHRLILSPIPKDMVIDHINHDTLDNTRSNLRICTKRENSYNTSAVENKTSKYLGVCKQKNRWKSKIGYNYDAIYLGWFLTEEEAARAYDKKARELFGEFANLNFKD